MSEREPGNGADGPPDGEERRDPRRRRRARLVGRILGLLSLGIALALFQFTQTTTGRNAAAALLQGLLDNAIDGDVEIGPVLGGNLLTRAVISSFRITGPDGRPFVALDSVALEYDPLALLLRRQVRLRSVEAAYADIRLRADTTGSWNYDRIFTTGPPPAPDSTPPEPLRFVISDARLHDGVLEIRMPWTEGLEGAERRRALAEARDPEGVWYAEETAEGEFERVWRVEGLNGRFPLIRLVDPPRPTAFALQDVGGVVYAVSEPLRIEEFTGVASFADTISIDIDALETPGSSLTGTGAIVATEPLWFDFDLEADPLSFQDLAWLPMPLPETGGGPMDLSLTSQGETTIVDVSNATVESGPTEIAGGLRLAMQATPRFESLDLELRPLRISWLDGILEREPTIDGSVTGTVSGSGPVDDLRIAADLTLRDLDPASGIGAPSVVAASGNVSLVEPWPVRDLELTLRGFEPRWVRAFGFEPPISGRLGGTVTLDRGGSVFTFAGDMSHLTAEGDLSVVSGSGTIELEEGSVIDVSVETAPLALAALRPFLPDVELVGSVSGPIRATGSLSALTTEAQLITPRGRLDVQGLFGIVDEVPTYDATLEASDIALDQWIENAPSSRLAVRGRVEGQGVDPATLDATFDLEILPSEFERAEIESSRLRFRIADGLAEIDTFTVEADVGSIYGRGRFGLAEDRVGTLEFEAEAADLSEWNRWVAEEIPGGSAADAGEDLFADFAAATARPEPGEEVEGLLGTARARGVAIGNVEDFSVEAFVEASGVRYGLWGADSLSARVQLDDPPSTDVLVGQLTATGALVNGIEIDSLDVELDRPEGGSLTTAAYARRDSTLELSGRAAVELGDGSIRAALDRARVRLGKVESSLVDPALVAYSDSLLRFDGVVVSGPLGRIEADGSIPASGDGDLAIQLVGLRLDQLGYIWSEEPEIGGTASATVSVAGTLGEPRFQGTVRVLDPAVGDHRYTSADARFDYAERALGGSMDLTRDGNRLARVEGRVAADLALEPLETRLLDDPIDVRVVADSLPLQLLELGVQGLEEIDGVVSGAVTLAGEPGSLRYGGSLRLRDGSAWVPDLGVRIVRVNGGGDFQGREVRLDSIVLASAAGGTGRIGGQVDLSTLSDPAFDLDLRLSGLRAVERRDMQLAVGGSGHLGGTYEAPELTGRFRLRDGDIRQDEFLREQQVLDLSDPSFYGLLDSASVRERTLLDRFRNPFMDNLVVDVELDMGPNLWLRSPTLDVEMLANGLEVYQNRGSGTTRIVGEVELPRGTYRFDRIPPYVQSLRITNGTIQFLGRGEFNPNLSIAAEYRNRTADGPVQINVQIGGTLRNTDLALSSDPPMSDSDQLCFLAVGAPCVGAADSQLGQRLVQEALLGTLSSGLSSALVGSTGLSYFNLTSIGGASPRGGGLRGSESLFDMTAVEFGWYASEEIFFTFQQPLRGGLPRATIEWRFSPRWTLEAKASSRFDDRLFGLFASTFADEQTFGLFLFREWTY